MSVTENSRTDVAYFSGLPAFAGAGDDWPLKIIVLAGEVLPLLSWEFRKMDPRT